MLLRRRGRAGLDRGACQCAVGHCQRLRQSEEAQDRTIILPLFPQMSFEQQDQVVAALHHAVCVKEP